MAKDFYDTLGVSRSASQDDIRRAFHKLAHRHHPDKSGGDAERFKEINEAYQTLSDPQKRSHYDQFGSTAGAGGGMNWSDFQRANQGGFGNATGADFGDLGDIFGDIFGFGRQRSRPSSRGSDVEVGLTIDFKEAVFGTEELIELSGSSTCERCSGNGAEPGSGTVSCTTCGGSGVIEHVQQTFIGGIRSQSVCRKCGGSGSVPKANCKRCHGTGSTRGKRRLKVTVPAGIDDGQSIRLTGQGESGPRGSRPGDLYLRIRVRPDAAFRRDGDDILTRRTVTFAQAALGATVTVETVDGHVELEIPAGTQPGTMFRMRGKGIPSIHGKRRGDQMVEVLVKVPEKLTKEQRTIIETLSRTE